MHVPCSSLPHLLRWVLPLAAAFWLVGCGNEQTNTPKVAPEDPSITQVRTFLTRYFKVWSDRDMAAYEALFDPTAVVHFVDKSGKVIAIPRPPFIQSQRESHASATVPMTEHAERMEIHLSPDARVAQAAVKWKLVHGDKITQGWDHFTLLRRDDAWHILNLVFYEE